MSSDPPPTRRWSLVDVGAAVAVLLALGGVIWSPKLSGAVAQVTGALQPVTVAVDVRGVPVADSAALLRSAEEEGKVSLVIRNTPHGTVRIRRIEPLQRRLTILTPAGEVVQAPDPNQQVFGSFDGRFLLEGQGRRTGGGVVFGNQTLKIGVPVELEGANYRFNGTVTDLTFEPS